MRQHETKTVSTEAFRCCTFMIAVRFTSLSHIFWWLPRFIGAPSVLRLEHCKGFGLGDHTNLQWNPPLASDESKPAWLQICEAVECVVQTSGFCKHAFKQFIITQHQCASCNIWWHNCHTQRDLGKVLLTFFLRVAVYTVCSLSFESGWCGK